MEFRELFSCIRDNRKLWFTDLSNSCILKGQSQVSLINEVQPQSTSVSSNHHWTSPRMVSYILSGAVSGTIHPHLWFSRPTRVGLGSCHKGRPWWPLGVREVWQFISYSYSRPQLDRIWSDKCFKTDLLLFRKVISGYSQPFCSQCYK